jgi:hypothetical protein
MDDFLNEGAEYDRQMVTSPASYLRGSLAKDLNYAMTTSFHIISSALFTTHPITETLHKVSY